MKRNWWKILGVVVIIYVIITGLLIPLGVGIEDFSPNRAKAGENFTLTVHGYNTMYTEKEPKVILKVNEEYLLDASSVNVIDNTELKAEFELPEYLPVASEYTIAAILVEDAVATAVLPRAISLGQDKIDTTMAKEMWYTDLVVNPESNINFPYRNILLETIRNQYFHVPMWFAMIILMTIGLIYSILALRNGSHLMDKKVASLNSVALLFGLLGISTGAIWANYTWGEPWSGDVKQNMAAICVLIYSAFFVFRASIDNPDKRLRVSNAYNIFAYAAMIPLLFVIPRMTDSLHPGSGGNPGMGSQDLDSTMRLVFYPAVIGWAILGYWISDLRFRFLKIKERSIEYFNI